MAARKRVEELRENAHTADGKAELSEALLIWSYALHRDGRTADAVDAAEEGIRILSPLFLADPHRLREEMNALVSQYLGVCQHSKRKVDMSLIKPLAGPLGQAEFAGDDD
ncbi:MAG: hypothetical protein HC834_03895 [Rhodospirillales bacterium]|nr:hypothetical protein [Rhodospirillales bacterium]